MLCGSGDLVIISNGRSTKRLSYAAANDIVNVRPESGTTLSAPFASTHGCERLFARYIPESATSRYVGYPCPRPFRSICNPLIRPESVRNCEILYTRPNSPEYAK